MTPTIQILDGLRSLLPVDLIGEHEAKPCAFPRTTEQVAAVTRYANQHNLSIEIVGAGTKRTWGNPIATDILLETTRLTGVISHSWQDLTATVPAGTPWSTMQRILATHNQQVALDPLWPETATVGGIIATNDSGALRHMYGSLRDLIIGMTIVLADGTIAKSGGKVVKNFAGYDLHKLMTGAFGTLGVITEVTFRLHPVPHHAQTFTISAAQVAQLAPLMKSIRDSHLLTQAIQLRGSAQNLHLDVQLTAHPDAKHEKLLQQMTEVESLPIELNSSQKLDARESLLAQAGQLILKATMLPTNVPAFAAEVIEKGGEFVVQSLGIMYASFPADELSYSLAEEFRNHVGLQGGTTFLLAHSASVSQSETWAMATEGELPSALSLMSEIKHRFDPNRVLNPGRFLGGI